MLTLSEGESRQHPTADGSGGDDQPASVPSRIVTVLSPKGGAGKTTVATNLAVGLAREFPRQVVLVDLDLQFGDVASALRLEPKTTMTDVARNWPIDAATIKLGLAGHRSGLYSLCAPLEPAEADEVNADHVAGALGSLHRSFRFVVVDTDPGLSERVLSALDLATDIVMVCTPEVPSISGLQKALGALDLVGLTGADRHFVLNRANARVGIDIADIEEQIGRRVDVKIPSSPDVVRATNEGIPIAESRTNASLAQAFDDLLGRFTAVPGEAGGTVDGTRRLFRRKAG